MLDVETTYILYETVWNLSNQLPDFSEAVRHSLSHRESPIIRLTGLNRRWVAPIIKKRSQPKLVRWLNSCKVSAERENTLPVERTRSSIVDISLRSPTLLFLEHFPLQALERDSGLRRRCPTLQAFKNLRGCHCLRYDPPRSNRGRAGDDWYGFKWSGGQIWGRGYRGGFQTLEGYRWLDTPGCLQAR